MKLLFSRNIFSTSRLTTVWLWPLGLSMFLTLVQAAWTENRVAAPRHMSPPRSSAKPSRLTQIVPGVYLYKDTCNVYAIVKGDEALLIDFGSGEILDELPSVGVRKVGWILHTHFHR